MYNANRGIGNINKTNKIGHRLLPTTLLKCQFFFLGKVQTILLYVILQ
jgi:hypothetical protein